MLATGLKPIRYTLETVEGKHIYTIEGEGEPVVVESVTTNLRVINKPGLNAWREKLGKEEATRLKEEGGDIGTMVHKAGLRLFKGEGYGSYEWSQLGAPTPEDERVRNAVRALELLRRERGMQPAAAEFFVWSRQYGFAGTGDAAIWVDDSHSAVDIYDWKTSGAIYPEVWLQLAPYAVGFEETYGVPVRRVYPVRLDRGLPNAKSAFYELGQTFKVDGVEQHIEYMEGDTLMEAFENYMRFQEGAKWYRQHGGRY